MKDVITKSKCRIANSLWKASCLPSFYRFKRAVKNCQASQEQYLFDLLRKNQNTAYGRAYGFSNVKSVEDFRRQVPLVRYDDLLPYIQRIAEGEQQVLTREKVLLFEPSSGSSAARKLIPYTAALRREFQQGIAPWMVSLHNQYPEVSRGRAYWSISPVSTEKEFLGAVPVGFDDDSAYLGQLARRLHGWAVIEPDAVSKVQEADRFRTRTLASLLAAEDLSLISVWSPSFLRLLLEHYLQHKKAVLDEVIRFNPDLPPARMAMLEKHDPASDGFDRLWPSLSVVSCWMDGPSECEATLLRNFLPNTQFQGKGLLATEAFISFPFLADHDPVLAVRSHFFEFIDEAGEVFLAHQLQKDCAYSVVVTTGGGLYRYQLDDQVLVTGFIGDTPTIRFLGKAGNVSDRYGEKLNGLFVTRIFEKLFGSNAVRFCMLAPDHHLEGVGYTLFVEPVHELQVELVAKLEAMLCENPHYWYCRELGQLQPVQVFKIKQNAFAAYESRCIAQGQRAGDIKPTPLSKWDGWSEWFEGGE